MNAIEGLEMIVSDQTSSYCLLLVYFLQEYL